MKNLPSRGQDPISKSDAVARPSLGRWVLILALVAFGVFYMMLAMGGASYVHECQTVVCGQLHQAVFAAIGALALFVGAHRVFEGKSSAAKIVFLGTVPILVVHVILVMTDPNEAIFFPLSTTPPPLISGAQLVRKVAC
jgi:hypothetical protein